MCELASPCRANKNRTEIGKFFDFLEKCGKIIYIFPSFSYPFPPPHGIYSRCKEDFCPFQFMLLLFFYWQLKWWAHKGKCILCNVLGQIAVSDRSHIASCLHLPSSYQKCGVENWGTSSWGWRGPSSVNDSWPRESGCELLRPPHGFKVLAYLALLKDSLEK